MLAAPSIAAALGSQLFDQSFANNSADGTGAVVKPATSSGVPNGACLTAAGGTTGTLQSCPGATDLNGSGALSLTQNQYGAVGGVLAATSVPTSEGLNVRFVTHQYSPAGNPDPADGIVFALAAVDPADPLSPDNIGPVGGSLGYSAVPTVDGLAHGYLGIGFDVYGNYSNTAFQGSGCAANQFARGGRTPNQVVVRGPGNGRVGYCAVNSTATSFGPPPIALRSTTRAASAVPVQIIVNSGTAPATTDGGVTVPANSYAVEFTPVGASQATTLTGGLPQMASNLVGSPSWLDSTGRPKQLAFGWVASTGSQRDNHEITTVSVDSLSVVPQLAVNQVSYTRSPNLVPGDPVSYVVTPEVATGVADPGPVSVTVTTPDGVKPLGGGGQNGWACAAPVDQKITCINSGGPFPAGEQLPPITVTAAAIANVTAQSVQTGTTTTASSDTGQAAITNVAPASTNPPVPTISGISPGVGASTGGFQTNISGNDLNFTTAIRVGTQAEINGGGGTLLLPCGPSPAEPCFTTSNQGIRVEQWPGHAAGDVVVQVIALGVVAVTPYQFVEFTPGSLLITEFRTSGPNGNLDEYVELTNNTDGPLPMLGVQLQSSSGEYIDLTDPDAVVPAGGTYLVAAQSYSLTSVASPDLRSNNQLGTGGVRVFAPGSVVTDAVGPNSEEGFHEGQGLPTFDSDPSAEYAWVRTQQTGAFKNTDDNLADFALVSTDGGVVGGVQSMLGSPSPTSMTSPWNRSSTITSTLIDPTKSANVAPNRVVTKVSGVPGGKIESRRVVTNNTGRTITELQLRLIDITEANGLTPLASVIPPGSPIANLKAMDPQSATVTVNGQTVQNVRPAFPSAPGLGGGLNSTFTVPLPGDGLAPGASVDVGLTFEAANAGKFFFRYSTEAKLAG